MADVRPLTPLLVPSVRDHIRTERDRIVRHRCDEQVRDGDVTDCDRCGQPFDRKPRKKFCSKGCAAIHSNLSKVLT